MGQCASLLGSDVLSSKWCSSVLLGRIDIYAANAAVLMGIYL